MSDELNAGGEAAGEQDAIAATDAGNTGAADTSTGDKSAGNASALAALTEGDEGKTEAAAPAPASWPEKWREDMAGGDEAAMAILKRLGSPVDLFKKVLAQEQTIRRGAHKTAPTLPENATEEQVAEYRKAIGIPETPDGYGLKFDAALKPGEADNAMLQGVLAHAHAKHVPPAHAQAMFEAYQQQMIRAREEAAANAQREFAQTKAELKREYGPDYLRNIKLLEEWLEDKPAMQKLVQSNLHSKSVMQEAISLARAMADEEALFGGDGSGGKSLDERITELRNKSADGTISRQEDTEYNKLLEQRMTRDARRQRGR